ncbi:substrate-binding domain-containing protein [Pseudotabrizicola sp. 4114]|uniref:substrate-binding domain-containing protein n=1 Tax=Pseudotabrizicola sp. 4114 TaxID=2817731 RepID=UPI00286249FD|nr:ribose transport system substrate-binding protein [Pseudorhodobacter sp. 4114]
MAAKDKQLSAHTVRSLSNNGRKRPSMFNSEETMKTYFRPRGLALAMLAAGLAHPYAALAQDHAVMNQHADIATMCGDKPAKVGLVDGFGGATWFRTAAAEFADEMKKCPNVEAVTYLDANGSAQSYNSHINNLVAQGVNVIVAFTHFGDASIPAYRDAKAAGVTMVPYFSQLGGEIGRDYDAIVYQDPVAVGGMWADWLGQSLEGKGNVLFMGGPAGAASSEKFMEGFKAGLAKFPEMTLLEDQYIVTNWSPVDAQQAIAALIAKYPEIDGIASDYGVTTMAAINAFKQAGVPVPAQATLASSNELNCLYLSDTDAGKGWKYFSLDGTTSLVRFAARRALSIYEGTENNEPLAVVSYPYADSEAGIKPLCDPDLPPDADMSGLLGAEKLTELLK